MKGNIKRIGLVLLTLLTLSLGTLVVNAETKDSDFVIENGVLKQYKGNDDTVYIPEGVTKIASDAFKNNEDIHKQAASKVLGIPVEKVTKEQRGEAKAVNFGIVYGISDYGLAQQLGITNKKAQEQRN